MSEQTVPSAVDVLAPTGKYHTYTALSPSGEKNQDRLAVELTETGWFATVCDGATQSACSADAAEVISSEPAALWKEGALAKRVEYLNGKRAELMASELPEPVDETSFLSRALAAIVRDKRQQAFQTTLISVRITPLAGNDALVEAKSYGDSALFVFDRNGRLVLSSLELEDANSPFDHASPFTYVLPDHFRGEEPSLSEKIASDAHVILCSDGFYDAFLNPGELFRWLLRNGHELLAALAELHEQLDRHRGDDDISLVWLCPAGIEMQGTDSSAVPVDVTSPQEAPTRGVLPRWLVKQLSRIFRFVAPPSGGLCW